MMKTYEDLTAAIERSVRGSLWSHPLIEDAIQEAHIDAWRRREANPDIPLGHLLVSARRKALDVAVGKPQTGSLERSPGSGSRKPNFTAVEELANINREPSVCSHDKTVIGETLVDQLLRDLEPDERTIARLMMDGLNHAEIGERLDRSVGWVRKRMPTMRAKLTPYLDDLRVA